VTEHINDPDPGTGSRAAELPLLTAPGASAELRFAPAVPVQPVVPRLLWLALLLLAVLSVASLLFAWKANERGSALEQELVRRQTDTASRSTEAEVLARQAQENVNAASAKVALLEARVAEVAVQRTQLEDLIQSLSRSRDENLLVDIDSAIRVALQQTAITGSAEPLVATLKQSDDRLARYNQPRLEGVRRAIARDLDRVKATSVADISSLDIKIDEAIRMVDDLPLLAVAEPRKDGGKDGSRSAATAAKAASGAASSAAAASSPWSGWIGGAWTAAGESIWGEVKSLVRVTRIDHPDAMLLAPDQSFFIRENLKLRLLNARLALLSRQFDTAQSDLQASQQALDRYFDRSSKRTQFANDLVHQVASQARQVGVPRPDDTLAALTAASAGR
jgi:uroporphyrin-III C-methyltransferase